MSPSLPRRVVIVGASAAGLTAAETLRGDGFDGDLTLVGAERHLAYDRPPLSKQLLAGSWEPARLDLLPGHRYAELGIELRLGAPATSLDVGDGSVQVGRDRIAFDAALVATGVQPRRWPATDRVRGVHTLRTLDDAVAFKHAALEAGRVVVIGAGFLGAEAAATLRSLGVEVTLIAPSSGPMLRQVGAELSRLVAELHREHEVDLRLGVPVDAITHDAGAVTGVRLGDGSSVAATCVLVAIGTTPTTAWLAGSGLDLTNGVLCDAGCRAAPGVYAAGDVARWFHRGLGATLRVEHRTNATEQGMAAARGVMGGGDAYEPVPYFWSDQYDTKIQAYGSIPGADRFAVISGSLEARRFVAAYGRGDRVVGVLGWRSPRELLRARRLVVDAAPWDAVSVGPAI